MRYSTMWGIVRFDWHTWEQTGWMWRLAGWHTAATAAVIMFIWPARQKMSALGPSNVFLLYAAAELILLSYIGLKMGANAWLRQDGAPPLITEWVSRGVSSAVETIMGKTGATAALALLLAVTSLPMSILAAMFSDVSWDQWALIALLTAVDTSLWILTGLLIQWRYPDQSMRSITCDTVYLIVAVGAAASVFGGPPQQPMALLNPIHAITAVTRPDLSPAFTAAAWLPYTVSRAALIVALTLALRAVLNARIPRRESGGNAS